MKFRRFIVASLTALVASVPTSGPLVACDQCRSQSPCRACATSDDRGLLDALDMAAQRMQPRLPRLTMPRLPMLNATLQLAFSGRVGCGPCATCGCEISNPSCGCELREPSCGCETSVYGEHVQPHALPDWQPSQLATPGYAHPPVGNQQPQPAPYIAPLGPSQPTVPHIDSYQHNPPQPLTPVRPRVPELVPAPDSQVDPFRDDSATRVRQIPSRTIQYRQPAQTYRQNFDPQANAAPVHMRLTDEAPPAAVQLALDDQTSSRSRGSQGAVVAPRAAVVTASGVAPQTSIRTYEQHSGQQRSDEPSNPLR